MLKSDMPYTPTPWLPSLDCWAAPIHIRWLRVNNFSLAGAPLVLVRHSYRDSFDKSNHMFVFRAYLSDLAILFTHFNVSWGSEDKLR